MQDTERETAITRVRDFIEENRELVQDPEATPMVLERVIVQGADIAVELSEKVTTAADENIEAANRLEKALRNKGVSPKDLQKKELLHNRRKNEYDELNESLNELNAFMDRARETYYARLEDGPVEPSTKPSPELPEVKRPWWRSLFS